MEPIWIAPASERGRGARMTEMTLSGALAELGTAKPGTGLPSRADHDLAGGRQRKGLDDRAGADVLEIAETCKVLPHEATGPAEPLTRRSGSEYPSEEYDSNCRPSSCSRAIRSVRRRVRRSHGRRRVSQGNTEHLPAAEGPRSLRRSGKAGLIPQPVTR